MEIGARSMERKDNASLNGEFRDTDTKIATSIFVLVTVLMGFI